MANDNYQNIPQKIFSETVREAIDGRKVKVVVFLTYEFDPAFFELNVLTLLFDRAWCSKPKAVLAQLETELRNIHDLAVYYDRRGIVYENGSARLDYKRIGLERKGGVFHPKNILLLVENDEEQVKWDSLIVVTTSANITRSGWWENVEVAHILEIDEGSKSLIRDDLIGRTGLLNMIQKEDRTGEDHSALEAIRLFLLHKTDTARQRSRNGILLSRLYVGRQTIPEFLRDEIGIERGIYNLEVISPYFDDTDRATTFKTLLETIEPNETRIFLPTEKDGAASCREEYFKDINSIPSVSWSKFPESITSWSQKDKQSHERFVHSKVYRIFSPRDHIDYALIGSINLTSAAHSSAKDRNFETAVFIDFSRKGKPDWWLKPISKNYRPVDFKPIPQEGEFEGLQSFRVTIWYNWTTGELSYFWEKEKNVIGLAEVLCGGLPLFQISPVEFDRKIRLPNIFGEKVMEILKSTSLIEIKVDDKPIQRVLVREEGMENKPSLLETLTPDEILEYWSLLSPEQKDSFLERKVIDVFDPTYMLRPIKSNTTSEPLTMFDRFAGIFHAFSCLSEHIKKNIDDGNEKEAIHLLFGDKFDSLPYLIDKVIEAKDTDIVNRYVTLLCARQLLNEIKNHDTVFGDKHNDRINNIYSRLIIIEEIKTDFTFDTIDEREKFFLWFEGIFFLEISKSIQMN